MESTKPRLSKKSAIIVFFILFYAVWVLNEFFGKTLLNDIFQNEHAVGLFNQIVTKNLVWTLPALLLVKRYNSEMRVRLKEMFTTKFKVLPLIGILLLITAYFTISAYRQHGNLQINESFGTYYIILYIFTGITEETVYRGWLLNATYTEEHPWRALIQNALMFLMIHFPIWIMKGQFISMMTSFSFIFLLMLSLLFSWLFLKNKNILPAIIVHAFWDIMTKMF